MTPILQSRIKKMSPLLLVTDIERSITFYTTIINFEVDFRYEEFYAGIRREHCSIHLKLREPSLTEKPGAKHKEDVDILFSIENIETFYKELTIRPVDIVVPLRSMPYGREFYISDPDGHVMAFVEER